MIATRLAAGFMVKLALMSALVAHAANPEVKIATGPLFSGRGNVHPNIVLSLSVEFPTVGVAYRGDSGTYNKNTEYVGYFNSRKCYDYHGGNRNVSDEGYFYIAKDADALHECGGDTFSGNFMNWAASSAIDMMRYALTGGDRIIDLPSMTVLQRAVLRDSSGDSFYAHATYFPRRAVTGVSNSSAPIQVTPFNTKTLYIVSCRNRILFSDQNSGLVGNNDANKLASTYCTFPYDGKGEPPKAATDKRLGEYLVRVKVCDATEAPQRPDLCEKYGTNYKPVGEIQRRATRLRLAAMGYLLDDSEKRYGGVLRAPMKYLGPKKLTAPDFLEAPNDKLEWDPVTGVFYNNPEDPADRDNANVVSGVINYLNKFGRSGAYKTYDPVGELYYEAIRYLQGKQPTPEAVAGMTNAAKDGFPVLDGWVDPVIASCQNSYIVTIADVNTHWDRYIPGNDRTTFGGGNNAFDSVRSAEPAVAGKTPELDVKQWTKRVAELETDTGGAFSNPSANPSLANLQDKDTGSGGHGTYYMAGLAYWANTHDIRLDKPTRVKTFTIDVDEGGNGLIDGNNRAIKPRNSQLYLAAKYGGFNDRNGDGNPFVTVAADGKTPIVGSNTEWDNGAGVPANYFLAGQPTELVQAIRKVFASIGSASGTIAGVSVSTTKISSEDGAVFLPGFDSTRWSGSLKKFKLSAAPDGMASIASTADWDAGEMLTGQEGAKPKPPFPLPEARSIYTLKVGNDGSAATVEFKWDKLGDVQRNLLDTSPVDGKSDGLGSKRLSFLRGNRTLELSKSGGLFRARDRVLGDIVNSNALFIGAPALNVQGDGYDNFAQAYKARGGVVYVGANDGMLHAFSTADGSELFAYVPNAVVSGLPGLTHPEYVHRPYVDGTLTMGEALVQGGWKTVLASGMGGGAQGVFALDVTNPANFAAGAGALFEFTDADDPDMGNLFGGPVVAKFRTKSSNGKSEYKYFLVVPSGLDNYRDDGANRFNTDGAAALFLLSLDKPQSAKWELGVNYYKFRIESKDPTLPNGLAAPALVVDGTGAVRFAYAGDLQGNLWRFNFTASAPWSNALAGSTPLFAAKDAKAMRQPITTQPKVVFAPGGGYLVLFGTGKFVEDADAAPGSFSTQSFYAIHDTTVDTYAVASRGELASRTAGKVGDAGLKIAGETFNYGEVDGAKKGWYLDFIDSDKTGERVVTNPLVTSGIVFFNSLIPGGDPCANGGGRSYAVNAVLGLPREGEITGSLSQVGMLSSPVVFQTGAEVSDRNSVGRRAVKKKYSVFNFGTGGAKGMAAPTGDGPISVNLPAGRFSWREILNWQEVRAVNQKK